MKTSRLARWTWHAALIGLLIVGVFTIGWGLAVLSVGVLLVSKILAAVSTDIFDPKRVTILNFWYVSYLVMILIPAMFVFQDQAGPHRWMFLFAVESALITVPLGWMVASNRMKFDRRETEGFFRKPIYPTADPRRYFAGYCFLSAICFLFLAMYIRTAPVLPIFYLFSESGSSRTLALLREESFKLLDSPLTYFFYSVRAYLFPFVILVAIASYLGSRQRKWLCAIFLTLGAGLFFASVTLAKAPVTTIFLAIGFLFYLCRSGSIGYKFVVLCLILILAFPISVVLVAHSGQGPGYTELLMGLVDRAFYKPAEVVYYYFEVFPTHVSYLHGRSIGKLSDVLGMKYFDAPNYVGSYGFADTSLDTVSANAAFIANLNADFGLWGVLLGGVLTGWIMQVIHIYLVRREKTVPCLACYSLLAIAFWGLHSTALPVVLASDGVIPLIVILLTFERWTNRRASIAKHSARRLRPPSLRLHSPS